eukprot:773353_1
MSEIEKKPKEEEKEKKPKEEEKEKKTEEFKNIEVPLVYTEEMVRSSCDPKEYGNRSKYSYINYLPFTIPTLKYRSVLSTIYNMKLPKVEPKNYLTFIRNVYCSEE